MVTSSYAVPYKTWWEPENVISHTLEGLSYDKALNYVDRFISEGFCVEMLYVKDFKMYVVKTEKIIEKSEEDK